jgi:hypothetical protein
MVSVSLEGLDRVTKKIDGMRFKIRHLEHVDVPHEMRDWETGDVHRHAPGTHRTRLGGKVLFRPHSRYEMARHRAAMRRILKHHGILRPPSTRPILRQIMIDRLRERMTRLVSEKLQWR